MARAARTDHAGRARSGRASAALAFAVALLVALGTTAAVAYAVRPVHRGPGQPAPASAPASPGVAARLSPPATATPAPSPCPTPRRLVVAQKTVTPAPSPTAAATPNPTRTPRPRRTATATAAPLYAAVGTDLASWSGPDWAYGEGVLANDGGGVTGQPWLAAPYQVPRAAYAVEADIRVVGLAAGKCEQSFGVVAGGGAGVVWGGGVIFACDGVARARITDVTDWTDGYNQDRLLAATAFDPGQGWHAYRLEVDGNRLRLVIDGRPVLAATDDAAATGDGPGQVGLWSQGVRLEVRRVAAQER